MIKKIIFFGWLFKNGKNISVEPPEIIMLPDSISKGGFRLRVKET